VYSVISILCLGRENAQGLVALAQNVAETISGLNRVELLVYLDNSKGWADQARRLLAPYKFLRVVPGGPATAGAIWGVLAGQASGELLVLGGDDLNYQTVAWDRRFYKASSKFRDGVFVLLPAGGRVPVVSRRWAEAAGYIAPAALERECSIKYLTDVAEGLGRLVVCPDVVIDYQPGPHLTPPDVQQLLYDRLAPQRRADQAKLQCVIDGGQPLQIKTAETDPPAPALKQSMAREKPELPEPVYLETTKTHLQHTDALARQDVRFTPLLKGKRVVLVGPAPYLMGKGQGPAIDAYDTVCRVNECWAFGCEHDYGQRTDIIFSSGARITLSNMQRSLRRNKFLTSELRFLVAAQRLHNSHEELFNNLASLNDNLAAYGRVGVERMLMLYYAGDEFWSSVFAEMGRPPDARAAPRGSVHGPLTGLVALRIILAHEPAELLVTGFSFFGEGPEPADCHYPGYLEWGGNDIKVCQRDQHPKEHQKGYLQHTLLPGYPRVLRIDSAMAAALERPKAVGLNLQHRPKAPYRMPGWLRKHLEGKRVIVAGPSPHLQGRGWGGKIDAYDIVCRVNELGAFGLEADYGSRTDILFHCGGEPAAERLLKVAEKKPAAWKQVKAVVIPQRTTEGVRTMLKRLRKPVHVIPEALWFGMNRRIGTYGNTGLLAVMWLLEQCQPKEVYVTGFSFYVQGLEPEQRHHQAYPEWGGDADSAGEAAPPAGQPGQTRQLPQFRFFSRVLLPAHEKVLKVDRYLRKLIKDDRLVYAVYRVFYGAKFLKASVESILPFVDKVFIFVYCKAFGGITEVRDGAKMIPIPESIDGIEEVARLIPSDKVQIILDDWPVPQNQFTHLLNDRILPWHLKPDTLLFIEADMVWRQDQLEQAFEQFYKSKAQCATPRMVELWREPHYAIPERRRRSCIFWDFRNLDCMPDVAIGGDAAAGGLVWLEAFVHNFGFCLDAQTMKWKHLLAIGFAAAIKDSPPNPSWLQDKWLSWNYHTNNENLGISIGYEDDIPRADPYPTEELPACYRKLYSLKLNLGDEQEVAEGWRALNESSGYSVDKQLLTGFADGTVEAIAAWHCLEHLDFDVVARLLVDSFRALKPGAWLRMVVPDAEQLTADKQGQASFGWTADAGIRSHYTSGTLCLMLQFAGFEIGRQVYFDDVDTEICVEAQKAYKARPSQSDTATKGHKLASGIS